MQKDRFMLKILLGFILVLGCCMIYFSFQDDKVKEEISDAVKIKNEYAELNNKVNEEEKKTYPYVALEHDNPFVIASENEVIRLLEKGSGIIYFGFAHNAKCRTLLPVLEEVAKEENIKTIYYLDISSIRDVLELDDRNDVIVKDAGTDGYKKIVDLLSDELPEYMLQTKDGKKIDTLEKRIYGPMVVAVLDGELKMVHQGTIKAQESGYDPLTIDQTKELKKTLKELVNTIDLGLCTEEAC